MFSFFGRSSEVRFDGYYQAEPYTDRQTVRNVGEFLDFGDREFLRFYPNGDCLKHWSTSDDIELILYSLDRLSQGFTPYITTKPRNSLISDLGNKISSSCDRWSPII